jgi:hypothetical protein
MAIASSATHSQTQLSGGGFAIPIIGLRLILHEGTMLPLSQ